jgi:uncharacterized membrane protein YgcG
MAAATAATTTAATTATATTLTRADCTYTAQFCEENAYLLSKALARASVAPSERLFAVFATNPRRAVPLLRQRAGRAPDGLCVWDYHVFVIEAAEAAGGAIVWDLDTTLPFPCALCDYVAEALPPVAHARYRRRYRVVPARALWRHFASDRAHMRAPGDGGEWLAPPPPYPPIAPSSGGAGCGCMAEEGAAAATVHWLPEYLDVGGGSGGGSSSGSEGTASESDDDEGGGDGGGGGDLGSGTELGFVLNGERALLRFFAQRSSP